jgi:hypothetical protein
MTCTGDSDLSQWSNPIPMSFDEWKSILSQWTTPKTTKCFSNSFPFFFFFFFCFVIADLSGLLDLNRLPTSAADSHRQSNSPGKKQERAALPRNQVFGDSIVDSFLISQSSNILQSSISLTRQGMLYH